MTFLENLNLKQNLAVEPKLISLPAVDMLLLDAAPTNGKVGTYSSPKLNTYDVIEYVYSFKVLGSSANGSAKTLNLSLLVGSITIADTASVDADDEFTYTFSLKLTKIGADYFAQTSLIGNNADAPIFLRSSILTAGEVGNTIECKVDTATSLLTFELTGLGGYVILDRVDRV